MHSKRPLCPGVLPGGVLREEGRVVLGALILVRRGGLAVGLSVRVPRPAAKTRDDWMRSPEKSIYSLITLITLTPV